MIDTDASRRPRVVRFGAVLATVALVGVTAVGCGSGPPQASVAPYVTIPAAPGAATGTAALTGPDVEAWLDGMLPAAMQRTGIAGATVAVVGDGRILTTRGYGHADTGGGAAAPEPVDPERHLFRPGSVSKVFTAVAALQLVQGGTLELDADIAGKLDFDLPRSFDEPITLRHLLTHTAGFEERVAGLIGTEGDSTDLRRALVTDPPEQIFRPGTVPAYSNYGYALAGYLVERTSGMPFEEYVQRYVIDRAGMTSSTFAQPLPPALRDRMSQGYPNSAAPAGPFEFVGVPPAGALSAPAPDMARFMLALLGEKTDDPALLDPPTLELMRQPGLDAGSLGTLAEGPRMSLGLFDESRNGHRILGHGGDTNYFHSHLQILPDQRAGLFISLNSGGNGGMDSHELRQAVLTGFVDRYFPAKGDQSGAGAGGTVDAETAAEHAAVLAGTYESSRTMRSTFLATVGLVGRTSVAALEDGRLLVEPAPLSTTPAVYEEVKPWLWREVGGQRTLAARVVDGQVEAIGFDSAFALLPVDPQRGTGLVASVLGASTLVLVLTVLVWPVAAVVRRRLGRAPRGRAGRTARVLSRVAVAGALLALVGWAVSLTAIMGMREVPTAVLRGVQVLQLVGLLGVLPATVRLVDEVRRRGGWPRIVGSALVLLALAGTGWFAVEFMLLAPSISY
ncbi:serine hydrolase domain-containing protein [Micromonospora sp. WMMA1923]|uniref:serine hydrolase domain-containing protein n=1 Tax=Micromonospora sp. WMMA1923 TaxID=3404125 RepID=UPI003B9647DB